MKTKKKIKTVKKKAAWPFSMYQKVCKDCGSAFYTYEYNRNETKCYGCLHPNRI